MRRFRVWIDKNEAGSRPWYETIELPDSATDDVCNGKACVQYEAWSVLRERSLDVMAALKTLEQVQMLRRHRTTVAGGGAAPAAPDTERK